MKKGEAEKRTVLLLVVVVLVVLLLVAPIVVTSPSSESSSSKPISEPSSPSSSSAKEEGSSRGGEGEPASREASHAAHPSAAERRRERGLLGRVDDAVVGIAETLELFGRLLRVLVAVGVVEEGLLPVEGGKGNGGEEKEGGGQSEGQLSDVALSRLREGVGERGNVLVDGFHLVDGHLCG